jgi:hypothetical protein
LVDTNHEPESLGPSSHPSPGFGKREFSFNKGTRAAFFLDESGISLFSTARGVRQRIIVSIIGTAIVLALTSLFIDRVLSLLALQIGVFASIFGVIGLFFILSAKTGKKLPGGSSKDDWAKSGVNQTSFEWTQVQFASITKPLRGPGMILSISAGSGTKRRSMMVRVEDLQVPDLESFLSEKLGGKFSSK